MATYYKDIRITIDSVDEIFDYLTHRVQISNHTQASEGEDGESYQTENAVESEEGFLYAECETTKSALPKPLRSTHLDIQRINSTYQAEITLITDVDLDMKRVQSSMAGRYGHNWIGINPESATGRLVVSQLESGIQRETAITVTRCLFGDSPTNGGYLIASGKRGSESHVFGDRHQFRTNINALAKVASHVATACVKPSPKERAEIHRRGGRLVTLPIEISF